MAPNGKQPTIVTTVRTLLSKIGQDEDVEQAIEEDEERKEREERREKRSNTKYGEMLNEEGDDDE